jgi:tetratricopeptide (TPR) repeat protein
VYSRAIGEHPRNRSNAGRANGPVEFRLEVRRGGIHDARIIRPALIVSFFCALISFGGCAGTRNALQARAPHADNPAVQARITLLDQKIASSPDDAGLLLQRARILMNSGEAARALADCQRAMTLQPSWIHARIQTGECLQDLGRTREAEKLQITKGLVRAGNGHVAEAVLREIAQEDERIDRNPDDPAPLIERAKTLRKLGLFNLASADSEAASALE